MSFVEDLKRIMQGGVPEEEIVAFLGEWTVDRVDEESLYQGARLMREFSLPFVVNPENLVDTCGTGGDEKGSFNFSTAAALVAAGSGVRVVKHGNRAVSSRAGSADVLEKLGVRVDVDPVVMRRALAEAGIAFLFAPRYHPAMRHVASARKKLGRKTLFNLLGPLTNPAKPLRQVVGIFDRRLMRSMAQVFQRLGSEHVLVVHGGDGFDEVTLTGPTFVVELKNGEIREWVLDPKDYDRSYVSPKDLSGRDGEHNALLLRGVLEGFEGALRETTLLNAAIALVAADRALDVAEGIRLAEKSIDTGEAMTRLKKLREITNQ